MFVLAVPTLFRGGTVPATPGASVLMGGEGVDMTAPGAVSYIYDSLTHTLQGGGVDMTAPGTVSHSPKLYTIFEIGGGVDLTP